MRRQQWRRPTSVGEKRASRKERAQREAGQGTQSSCMCCAADPFQMMCSHAKRHVSFGIPHAEHRLTGAAQTLHEGCQSAQLCTLCSAAMMSSACKRPHAVSPACWSRALPAADLPGLKLAHVLQDSSNDESSCCKRLLLRAVMSLLGYLNRKAAATMISTPMMLHRRLS